MTDQLHRSEPSDAGGFMRQLRAAQAEIVRVTEHLKARTERRDAAVVELLDLGWSEREVARIAGLSHVRVHQIREAAR